MQEELPGNGALLCTEAANVPQRGAALGGVPLQIAFCCGCALSCSTLLCSPSIWHEAIGHGEILTAYSLLGLLLRHSPLYWVIFLPINMNFHKMMLYK